MGQQPPTAPSYTPPTFQQLQQYVERLFNPQDDKTDQNTLHQALCAVLDDAGDKLPAEMIDEGMRINLVVLKVLYQPGFASTILKFLNLLSEKLQQLNKRNFLLIKREELIFLLNLTSFVLFFTDQKLIQTMHTFTFRKDLTQDTLTYIHQLENKGMNFNVHKNFFDKLTPAQAQQMHEILQNILIKLISSRTQILARSSLTFEVVSQIQPCLFILLVKLIKSPFHAKNFWAKIRKGDALKYHFRIGQYFLGQGCDQCRPSIYQSAVLLLIILIEKNQKNLTQIEPRIGAVPSHLFKNIPIPLKNTFYHFISMACLFSLAFVKEGSEYYARFSFNRIPTLILLGALISEKKVTSPQVTEFLEKVCLQTRIGSIERGFMSLMVEKYNKLVKEKIKENKRMQEVKRATSGFTNKFLQKVQTSKLTQKPSPLLSAYSTQSIPSQILQKYLISGSEPYIIKFSYRRYMITPGMLVQEFERNDDGFVQNQLKSLCEKFTYEKVLGRKVEYKFIDTVEWNAVLPRIIRAHNLLGVDVVQKDGGMKGLGREKRVVGSMPVIRQRYVSKGLEGSTKSDKQSQIKNQKSKQKSVYLQTEAAQNMYQHTAQDQGAQDFKRQLKQTTMIKQQQQVPKSELSQKVSNEHNGISLVFEEQERTDMEQEVDECFMTSQLELNKNKRGEGNADNQDRQNKQQTAGDI